MFLQKLFPFIQDKTAPEQESPKKGMTVRKRAKADGSITPKKPEALQTEEKDAPQDDVTLSISPPQLIVGCFYGELENQKVAFVKDSLDVSMTANTNHPMLDLSKKSVIEPLEDTDMHQTSTEVNRDILMAIENTISNIPIENCIVEKDEYRELFLISSVKAEEREQENLSVKEEKIVPEDAEISLKVAIEPLGESQFDEEVTFRPVQVGKPIEEEAKPVPAVSSLMEPVGEQVESEEQMLSYQYDANSMDYYMEPTQAIEASNRKHRPTMVESEEDTSGLKCVDVGCQTDSEYKPVETKESEHINKKQFENELPFDILEPLMPPKTKKSENIESKVSSEADPPLDNLKPIIEPEPEKPVPKPSESISESTSKFFRHRRTASEYSANFSAVSATFKTVQQKKPDSRKVEGALLVAGKTYAIDHIRGEKPHSRLLKLSGGTYQKLYTAPDVIHESRQIGGRVISVCTDSLIVYDTLRHKAAGISRDRNRECWLGEEGVHWTWSGTRIMTDPQRDIVYWANWPDLITVSQIQNGVPCILDKVIRIKYKGILKVSSGMINIFTTFSLTGNRFLLLLTTEESPEKQLIVKNLAKEDSERSILLNHSRIY